MLVGEVVVPGFGTLDVALECGGFVGVLNGVVDRVVGLGVVEWMVGVVVRAPCFVAFSVAVCGVSVVGGRLLVVCSVWEVDTWLLVVCGLPLVVP